MEVGARIFKNEFWSLLRFCHQSKAQEQCTLTVSMGLKTETISKVEFKFKNGKAAAFHFNGGLPKVFFLSNASKANKDWPNKRSRS